MSPTTVRTTTLCLVLILLSHLSFAGTPPLSNDDCSGATLLTLNVTTTGGTVKGATASTGIPLGTCTGTPDDDVWYRFTLSSTTSIEIDLSNIGSNLSSSGAVVQLLSGSCGSLSSLACGTTTLSYSNLASGTYYVRVFSAGATTINSGANFDITVSGPPSNDDCSGATTLSDGVTNSAGTVWQATASGSIPTGCATGNPDDDVWYVYTTPASAAIASISLSSIGSNLSTSGAMIQVFTGSCGSLNSYTCGNTSLTMAVSASTTYYIRVYSAGTGSIGGTSSGSAFSITATSIVTANYSAGRMNEVFQRTVISSGAISTPWEVTYGPDGFLWVTGNNDYKAYRIDPGTGAKTTILDLSDTSTVFPLLKVQFHNVTSPIQSPWPQGGFAGLAIHPQFNSNHYVYISYSFKFDSVSVLNGGCAFFKNSLVRFTYNTSTNKLESPVVLCDTLPGGNDHNSQRLIIAPVGGTYYLFYPQGDMGAGQLACQWRPNHAQDIDHYEGKILRFNLEPDPSEGTYDQWIPNDNPYNATVGKQSAVWAMGVRNNQGWAYDTTLNILYGASHGPYSDDEVNVIEPGKNYGHPLVIGFAADGNYNGSNAGSPNTTSSLAIITDEASAAAAIPNYKDPLFSGYDQPQSVIHNIWLTNPSNGTWPSEAWSGMDIYKNTIIPGWKNSLILAGLKWGRVLRLKLGPDGKTILPTNGVDTVAYFQGHNRYRDIAFAPNGKDMYVSNEGSTSSGPAGGTPLVPTCTNCIVKYTFLGYADAGGKSSIPNAIDVTDTSTASYAPINTVDSATTVTIDNTNNKLWVPITGPDGNILAEIYANGYNLGVIHSAFFKHKGTIRVKGNVRYLDRNITITPQVQPGDSVKIRLYITKSEFDSLKADPLSGLAGGITSLRILKNEDPCGSSILSNTITVNTTYEETHGNGYMLQGNIRDFSSFYFASSNITLPLNLLTFKGSLQSNNTTLLNWETTNETNTSYFIIERSTDGTNFQQIGTATAKGSTAKNSYSFTDDNAMQQSASVLYYRLKMVDINGDYTYSDVVAISLPSLTNRVSVFPNPASKDAKISLNLPTDGKVKWTLTDNAGRVILQNSALLKKGNNSFSIHVDRLSAGIYYINVTGAGIDQKVKLEKL